MPNRNITISSADHARPLQLVDSARLDPRVPQQHLDLLAREQRRRHMAMIILTHHPGAVPGRTDDGVRDRAIPPAMRWQTPWQSSKVARLPW